MRDQCLLWENYTPPQETEGNICYREECWDEGKRLGKWNRFDFWSSAPWEQSMVTLQPERKLPLRPSLFRIWVFTFNRPAGSLIKCTAHTSIQANKTQWSPNTNHSFNILPLLTRAKAIRSARNVPWRWRALQVPEQPGEEGRRGEVKIWGLFNPTAVLQALDK